jgi:DNA polymerase III subunit epsilon
MDFRNQLLHFRKTLPNLIEKREQKQESSLHNLKAPPPPLEIESFLPGKFAILDIESTNAEDEDQMIEISILIWINGELKEEFQTLVRPTRLPGPRVLKLTHISEESLKKAPEFHDLADELERLTRGAVLVSHYADKDYQLLKRHYQKLGKNFDRTIVCTFELTKKLCPQLKSYALESLAHFFGIPLHQHHRAYPDALCTLQLFHCLVQMAPRGMFRKPQL